MVCKCVPVAIQPLLGLEVPKYESVLYVSLTYVEMVFQVVYDLCPSCVLCMIVCMTCVLMSVICLYWHESVSPACPAPAPSLLSALPFLAGWAL